MIDWSISLQRPAGIILVANESEPMIDNSSHFRAFFLSIQASIAGSLSSSLAESTTIPRNVMAVSGPSSFSIATGMPSWEQMSSIGQL